MTTLNEGPGIRGGVPLTTFLDVDHVSMSKGDWVQVLDNGYLAYITHLGDDLTPIEAARMSTGNPTGVDAAKDAATRDFLWRHSHATPFEMAVLQIEVQVPIFVAREWMRHRTQSFNEFSGRYAEMPALFYSPTPDRVRKQSDVNKQGSGAEFSPEAKHIFIDSIENDQVLLRESYEEYLANDVARELARINLPLSQYTRFRAQANLRNWLHFLNLRMAPNAQYEIRVYAHALAELIQVLWPETWAVFEEHTLRAKSYARTEHGILVDAVGHDPSIERYIRAKAQRLPKGRRNEFFRSLGMAEDQ